MAGAGLVGAVLVGCGGDDDEGDGGSATATAAPGDASATAGATAAPTESAMQPTPGGRFRRSVSGDPTSLDPYANASFTAKTLASHVYSRLLKLETGEGQDPFDLGPTFDAAESAESADGLVWTSKLQQGIKFQDIAPVSGRELNAADVVFSFGRLRADESPNNSAVKNIVDVQAVDDYTINVTLDAPGPEFLEQMAASTCCTCSRLRRMAGSTRHRPQLERVRGSSMSSSRPPS